MFLLAAVLVVIWFLVVPLVLVSWSLMRDVGGVPDMLRAIAALWWPLIVAFVLLTIAPQLPTIVRRLRRASWGSGVIELDPETREVESKVEVAEAQQADISAVSVDSAVTEATPRDSELLAAPDKGLAFIRVAASLEEALRGLGAISGLVRTSQMTIPQLVSSLEKAQVLTNEVAGAVLAFWRTRNRVIHARGEPLTDRDLTALVDSGSRLLRVVRSIHLSAVTGNVIWRVRAVVQLFLDRNVTRVDPEWRGLIVEPGNLLEPIADSVMIFPTNSQLPAASLVNLKFVEGSRVSIRWYRDPADDIVRPAWSVSTAVSAELIAPPGEL